MTTEATPAKQESSVLRSFSQYWGKYLIRYALETTWVLFLLMMGMASALIALGVPPEAIDQTSLGGQFLFWSLLLAGLRIAAVTISSWINSKLNQ
jgi:hypothetical protein